MENRLYFLKALTQYGIVEFSGIEDNPEILKYFSLEEFKGAHYKDETAWCSAFVNWCCKTSGVSYSGALDARSWLTVGNQTTKPVPGDIVVLWRENPDSWKGHVGFYISEDRNRIYMLGGNQKNAVNISAYPKERLLQYRELC